MFGVPGFVLFPILPDIPEASGFSAVAPVCEALVPAAETEALLVAALVVVFLCFRCVRTGAGLTAVAATLPPASSAAITSGAHRAKIIKSTAALEINFSVVMSFP